MKRYILILALVSIQANIALPNIWENFRSNLKSNFQSKMNSVFGYLKFKTAQAQEKKPLSREELELKAIVAESFGNRFGIVAKKNLNEQQLNDFNSVKNQCSERVLRLLSLDLSLNKKLVAQEEGGRCMADLAVIRAEEQAVKQAYSQEAKNDFVTKTRHETFDKYMSGERGNLSYLFKDRIENPTFAKLAEMSNQALDTWKRALRISDTEKKKAQSREARYKAKVVELFKNRLATVAGNDLDEDQLDGYYVVKNHCNERIVQFFNTFPELLEEKSNRETNTELEGAKCLSDFARVLMRERTGNHENNFNGLYMNTFWTYMSGQPGSLSILFKDRIKNSVFKELQRETKEVWQKDLEEDFKKHQAKS